MVVLYYLMFLFTHMIECLIFFTAQATPKPILTPFDLSFPLAASDLGAESLENEFMMNNMRITEVMVP